IIRSTPAASLFPYTTLFRSRLRAASVARLQQRAEAQVPGAGAALGVAVAEEDGSEHGIDAEEHAAGVDHRVDRHLVTTLPDAAAFQAEAPVGRHREQLFGIAESTVIDAAQQAGLPAVELAFAVAGQPGETAQQVAFLEQPGLAPAAVQTRAEQVVVGVAG